MQKVNLYIERFWLIIIVLVAVFCVYEFIVDGPQVAKWYLLFLILPIFMWLFRRTLRIRMDKHIAKQKELNNKKKKK